MSRDVNVIVAELWGRFVVSFRCYPLNPGRFDVIARLLVSTVAVGFALPNYLRLGVR
jgi:hypothetical protein